MKQHSVKELVLDFKLELKAFVSNEFLQPYTKPDYPMKDHSV